MTEDSLDKTERLYREIPLFLIPSYMDRKLWESHHVIQFDPSIKNDFTARLQSWEESRDKITEYLTSLDPPLFAKQSPSAITTLVDAYIEHIEGCWINVKVMVDAQPEFIKDKKLPLALELNEWNENRPNIPGLLLQLDPEIFIGMHFIDTNIHYHPDYTPIDQEYWEDQKLKIGDKPTKEIISVGKLFSYNLMITESLKRVYDRLSIHEKLTLLFGTEDEISSFIKNIPLAAMKPIQYNVNQLRADLKNNPPPKKSDDESEI